MFSMTLNILTHITTVQVTWQNFTVKLAYQVLSLRKAVTPTMRPLVYKDIRQTREDSLKRAQSPWCFLLFVDFIAEQQSHDCIKTGHLERTLLHKVPLLWACSHLMVNDIFTHKKIIVFTKNSIVISSHILNLFHLNQWSFFLVFIESHFKCLFSSTMVAVIASCSNREKDRKFQKISNIYTECYPQKIWD